MRAQTENNRQRDRNARYRTTPGRWPSPPISARPCGPTASGDSRIGSQLQPTEPDATNTTSRNRSTSSDRPQRLADYRDTHDDATTNRAFQHQTSAHLRSAAAEAGRMTGRVTTLKAESAGRYYTEPSPPPPRKENGVANAEPSDADNGDPVPLTRSARRSLSTTHAHATSCDRYTSRPEGE